MFGMPLFVSASPPTQEKRNLPIETPPTGTSSLRVGSPAEEVLGKLANVVAKAPWVLLVKVLSWQMPW